MKLMRTWYYTDPIGENLYVTLQGSNPNVRWGGVRKVTDWSPDAGRLLEASSTELVRAQQDRKGEDWRPAPETTYPKWGLFQNF